MAKQFMLTTIDNPFNPFEDYKSWLSYDKGKGYDSAEKVMRYVDFLKEKDQIDDEITDYEETNLINRAIDVIIKRDFLHIYRKVEQDLIPIED